MQIKCPYNIKLAEANNKKIVFLDIDGVIGDWLGRACKTLDLNPEDEGLRGQLKKGIYLDKILGITQEEMWAKIDKEGSAWWEEIELLPWANELHDLLKESSDLAILTAPSDCPCSSYGKQVWAKKYFPDTPIFIGKEKHLCSHSNAILVDDSDKNIKVFSKKGKVFQWPNQYLILDEEIKLNDLLKELKEML